MNSWPALKLAPPPVSVPLNEPPAEVIGTRERDAWLGHMTAAVESMDFAPAVRKALLDYFESASTAMINQPPLRPE